MKPHWVRTWVERLRTQPAEVKSHVAFIAAGALTTLVALVWATTLPARIAKVGNINDTVASGTALVMDALSPLAPVTSDERAAPDKYGEEYVASPQAPDSLKKQFDELRDELKARRAGEAPLVSTTTEATKEYMNTEDVNGVGAEPSTVGKPVLIEVR